MSYLIHPLTQEKVDLFSLKGKQLLKQYIKLFQVGGAKAGGAEVTQELSDRQKELINESRYNLRRIMELINTDNKYMIDEIGGELLDHLSENRLKIFDMYRDWARHPDNSDSPEDLEKVMFLFGKPTSKILQLLDALYIQNNERNEWFSSLGGDGVPSNAFMLGVVETEDGQILISISGDPSTTASETNKLYENVYYHLLPMLNNLGHDVIEDDKDDGKIINNYMTYKNYYTTTKKRVGSQKKWGTVDENVELDLNNDLRITYVHNNEYLYGVRYVPFKREKGANINCNNGSSCVESKLFSYMHRNKLIPKGMTACWIGGNAKHKTARRCMDSYSFCIKDGKEQKRDAETNQERQDNDRVLNVMCDYLKDEIGEAFGGTDEDGNIITEDKLCEKSKQIMEHFAVPCPGCQMNEIRYKNGLPEIKWVNKMCSDIEKDKLVGGIEHVEKKTPDNLHYTEARGDVDDDNGEGGEGDGEGDGEDDGEGGGEGGGGKGGEVRKLKVVNSKRKSKKKPKRKSKKKR